MTGLVRGDGEPSLGSCEHLRAQVKTIPGDLLAPDSLRDAIARVRPREVYHLAAPSFIPASWERPGETLAAIAGSAAGVLEAVRDWSFAGDVVRAEWMMLQQERADDYILASGVGRTVAEFAQVAFACVELEAERFVRVDPSLVRAPEATPSVGDPAKARARLGWEPAVSFEQLVERMVRADLQRLEQRAGRS